MPTIYQQSFNAVDPTNSGETSVNSLSRVLSTSSLPATTIDKVRYAPLLCSFPMFIGLLCLSRHTPRIIDITSLWRYVSKIVNLVSTRPRVSKLEFFVALALVALAQTGKGT